MELWQPSRSNFNDANHTFANTTEIQEPGSMMAPCQPWSPPPDCSNRGRNKLLFCFNSWFQACLLAKTIPTQLGVAGTCPQGLPKPKWIYSSIHSFPLLHPNLESNCVSLWMTRYHRNAIFSLVASEKDSQPHREITLAQREVMWHYICHYKVYLFSDSEKVSSSKGTKKSQWWTEHAGK